MYMYSSSDPEPKASSGPYQGTADRWFHRGAPSPLVQRRLIERAATHHLASPSHGCFSLILVRCSG
uniref:Uncharacterized protein n=1 Tax=Triticum urartu TaxID=4572 RepID=A0A8R7K731_TRIUA